MQPCIVGVRFNRIGKVYHFDATSLGGIQEGEHVIVDTVRGRHLGEVVQVLSEPSTRPDGGWKHVDRRATPRDLLLQQSWRARQAEAMISCRARVVELGLTSIKIIAAEYNFDGSRLVLMFSTDSDEKPDLKSLRKDMQAQYPACQVELRQIGPRDVARILGGMGACGLEMRCCSQFLSDFSPISIKMAKEQGISLTPTEITGMCGRLRCCLLYEYEQYVEARKQLPKRNKRVVTPRGEGKVVDVLPLSGRITVLMDSDEDKHIVMSFDREEIQPWDELEALKRKSDAPCEKHDNDAHACSKDRRA
jgi:cell fate regulator YaaT (PSP1 superfamily)